MKNVPFVKCVPDYKNPENVPMLIVMDDLIDTAYSTKVSELFLKGSHHRNISLVLITQNMFYQIPSLRDISLNSKYIVDKTQIVNLARQVYTEKFSSFHKTYLEAYKDPHSNLFLDLTQSINDVIIFRTMIFPSEITEVFRNCTGK